MATITYTWAVKDCATYNEMNGQTDVIFMINATLSALNQSTGYSNTIEVPVAVPYGTEFGFKPFDQVTEAEVVKWIENTLAPSEIERLKTVARSNIETVSIKKLKG